MQLTVSPGSTAGHAALILPNHLPALPGRSPWYRRRRYKNAINGRSTDAE